MASERKRLAERLFRGVYGGDPAVVDELAASDIVASYPVFARLFGVAAIRGVDAYRDHASNFKSNWAEAEIWVHESVEEGDQVVLVWSFQGRFTGRSVEGGPQQGQIYSWGGFTLFRFDADGSIVAEIGEESDPGPFARLKAENSRDGGR